MIFSLFSGQLSLATALVQIMVCLLIIILVLPFHEWAHGYAAYKLGDNTAKYSGRLTLNPLAHIDPFGSLCLLLFNFGWAKPVPVNFNRLKNKQWGTVIVSLAGPFANILAGLVGGLVFNAIIAFNPMAMVQDGILIYVMYFLQNYIAINALLAVFNLLPLPPLDGSKILFAFLPQRIVMQIYQYQQFFFIIIYVLLFSRILSVPLNFLQTSLTGFIYNITSLPFAFIG